MRRPARILAELEATRVVSADDLARVLGVSKRTVANEIGALNEALDPAAAIAFTDGRYRLLVADPRRYRDRRDEQESEEGSFNDPDVRASFIIASLFRAVVPLRIEELAHAMSVGRTTVVADLNRVRELVASADLTIEGRPNVGLVLQGPELLQRLHILRSHFAMAYRRDARLEAVEEVARRAAAEAGLDQAAAPELARWAVVALDREFLGRPIDYLPNRYGGLTETPAHRFATDFAAALRERFDIELAGDDVTFLALPVLGMRAPDDAASATHFGVVDGADGLVEEVLEAVHAEMNIDLAGSELLAEFGRHVSFMINRMRYRIWVDDSAIANLRTEFPVAYQMATVASKVVERRIGLPVDQSEIGFLAAYFQVFLEGRITHKPSYLRVTVVACTGRVTAELVRLQLARILPVSTQLETVALADATPAALAQADLVVVTGEGEVECAAPVLHVTRVLDRNALERQLERLQLRLPLAHTGSSSVLANSLDESHFFALPANTGYLDAVEYMARRLEAKGLVERGFGERILEREAQAQMTLDPWVGFPHAQLQSDQAVMLAVGVVPRQSGDDGVRLIVLLGVPASGRSDDVLVAVYDEVLRLGSRRDLIDGVSRVTSYEDFYYFMENNPQGERER